MAGPILPVAGDIFRGNAVGIFLQPDLPLGLVIGLVDVGRIGRVNQRVDIAVVLAQAQIDGGPFLVEIHPAIDAAKGGIEIGFLRNTAGQTKGGFIPLIT